MNILVSACLLGTPCRYDGTGKPDSRLEPLRAQGHTLIPVCPEVLGGLPTPRSPAELQPDGRVLTQTGQDVTEAYRSGAERALELARDHGCPLAVLKERSPSCGRGQVYDGTFSRTLTSGSGVTAQLLAEHGIRVLGESQLDQLIRGQKSRSIRILSHGETDQLLDCLQDLAAHHNRVSVHFPGHYPVRPYEQTLALFSDSILQGRSQIAVVESQGRVVGFCKIDLEGTKGKLDYLAVLHSFRGQGYGTALMDWAMDTFQAHRIEQIEVKVVDGNGAIHLYEKYGFRMSAHILWRT